MLRIGIEDKVVDNMLYDFCLFISHFLGTLLDTCILSKVLLVLIRIILQLPYVLLCELILVIFTLESLGFCPRKIVELQMDLGHDLEDELFTENVLDVGLFGTRLHFLAPSFLHIQLR